jgi:4-amino-4-deoxy-L-arabinose transferase-like glycosyltransferase
MTVPRARLSLITVTLGTLILLIAAALRIVAFDQAPPGLQHDEIFKAQEGIALITQGDFRLFYPTNQGHEGGFVWLLGVSYALFGQNLLMVRFPALAAGLLTVALTYRVAGEAFGRRTAFTAAGLTAVSMWALYVSRVGLRATLLPVMVLLVLWGLLRLYRGRRPWRTAVLTGIALGLSLYTYTSAFALFAAFGAFCAALLAFDRPRLHRLWRPLIVTGLIAAALALPMLVIRVTDPQGTNRVSTISRPLNDALDGRPQELIDNGLKLLGMPAVTGDPEWRYNVADRPLFPLPVGLLVYAGAGLMLWRIRRQPLFAAILALMLVGLIPSLLTVSAPSFLRSIGVLPPVMLALALAINTLPRRMAWGASAAVIAIVGLLDARAFFVDWPQNDEVHAIYRDDLEQLAAVLRANPTAHAFVSTTDTGLDPMIFAYYNPPDATRVTFFDGRTTLALGTAADSLLFVSPDSPITPPHADWLDPASGSQHLAPLLRQDGQIAYEVYQLDGAADALAARLADVSATPFYVYPAGAFPSRDVSAWAEPVAYPANFGGIVALVGADLSARVIAPQRDGVNLQLYFQPVQDGVDRPLNVFVHMLRLDGTVHAQRDLLGVPTIQWQTGSTFIQDSFVIAGDTPPGEYIIAMGMYDFVTGERLPILTADGRALSDHLILGAVRVGTD